MRKMYQQILLLTAGGLLWAALAPGQVLAQSPKVEKQTTKSSSSSKAKPRASTPRATPRSRPTRDRSSSPQAKPGDSGKTGQSSTSSRSGSSASNKTSAPRRQTPRTTRETRGGRNYERYRDSKREQHVGESNRRVATAKHREREAESHDRRDHANRDHDQRHRTRNRDHRGHRGYRGGYGGYYSPRYPYFGAFGFCFPGLFELGYPYYGHRNGPVTVYVDGYRGDVGALDLDVSPEEAQIYVDGNYVGVADDYDGFPTFLWLEEGTYDLAIYRSGYETIFRQYTVYPGIVIDVEDRMRRGESVHPEQMQPKATINRDERIRRNREREEEVRREDERGHEDDLWESETRDSERSYPSESAPEAESGDSVSGDMVSGAPVSGDIARLLLEVQPSDAVVYLDGNFLGTGSEVQGLRAGLVVDPGQHTLEVVRPGYETREVEISLSAGERVDLMIELDRD